MPNSETPTEIASITENRSVSRRAVEPGITSIATTSTTPTICNATTLVSANMTSSIPPSRRGRRPIACAKPGSKAYSTKSRRFTSRTAPTTAARASTCHTSSHDTPSTFPKRMWLRSVFEGVTEIRISPKAKRVVKTIPIAASSRTRPLRCTAPMSATATRAAITAPTAKGAPAI